MSKAQEMLDAFMRRDKEAVDRFNWEGQRWPGSPDHVQLLEGRLNDVAALCMFLLKQEAAREGGDKHE